MNEKRARNWTVALIFLAMIAAYLLIASSISAQTCPSCPRATPTAALCTSCPRATPTPNLCYIDHSCPKKTPVPTSTPPLPAAVGEHDTTAWHAPALGHDHGANPATAHPDLQAAMAQYWTQEIGSAWQSSEHENMFPGKHAGFTNLIETNTGCPQFKGQTGDLCVTDFVLQVHALGTNAHALIPIHSWKGVFRVCDKTMTQCGTVVAGGHHDYGVIHAPYKKAICDTPDDVPVPAQYQFNAPYTALATEQLNNGNNRIFWNSLGPPGVLRDAYLSARGHLPNRGMGLAFAELDAFDHAPGYSPGCADPATYVDSAKPTDNGSLFQVYTLRYELPEGRPFDGYVDSRGNVVEGCAAESVDCVPLHISASVPEGRLFLNRSVGPQYAPLLEYDDGTPLEKFD